MCTMKTFTKKWWGWKANFEALGLVEEEVKYDKDSERNLSWTVSCNVCGGRLSAGKDEDEYFHYCKNCRKLFKI